MKTVFVASSHFTLVDMQADIGEKNDLAAQEPEKLSQMKAVLNTWEASCSRSQDGADYRYFPSSSSSCHL